MGEVFSTTVRRVADGALSVGGCDVRDLAGAYGTPLYIVDEEDLRGRARAFREGFGAAFGRYGAEVDVYYASKALLSSKIARWMFEDDMCMDVASGGELEIALRGGMPPERIGLHGNNKSDAELRRALEAGVGRIIVDSMTEIETLNAIALELDLVAPVMVRITTGVHAGGHEYIATAHEDQKFGLSLASGAAFEALLECHDAAGLRLNGIHTHIGSQILSLDAFQESAERMLGLRAAFAADTGIWLDEVDLGGGFAIRYTPDDEELAPHRAAAGVADAVAAAVDKVGGPWPRFSIEPGRAIAGPAGMTLYRVGVVKHVALEDGGARQYVAVDGGMSDHMRTITYGASYTATVASRVSEAEPARSRVVGKHCESGDIVVKDVELPSDTSRGDLLAVPATGAYGRTMSNNYNALLRPAVVSVRDGEADVHIRRDTLEDLLSWDVAP
ncbi:diaminopimelate decarboxylase [Demequina pelophila]|uniref:diaminopimelate decarboxylase n=1 Tax=Demequina pelophila TaxID=1638984 RepID=UPI000783C6ED|nr:diaminopimelate decarboxylase [Demequina pelophila]